MKALSLPTHLLHLPLKIAQLFELSANARKFIGRFGHVSLRINRHKILA
jgi:hypothetical protein